MRSLLAFGSLLTALLFAWAGGVADAQATVPVVLLSDIHFDPFHNPHDLSQLRAAPVEQWPKILQASASLGAAADRLAADAECLARTSDTGWPLLQATLLAAHTAEPHPAFVTLSGDLLAHEFPCRFRHLAPGASAQDLSAFSAKVVAFVAMELQLSFPHVPVYVALGNNDSGCADYRETPGSAFLQAAAATLAAATRRADGAKMGSRLPPVFSPEGDYSVALPAPFDHGRLIVLQDIFDARNYRTCASTDDRGPEAAQAAWLRTELAEARTRHEQVWVMGHIPPGIDVYASFHRYLLRPGEVCSANLQPFLSDTTLADTLLDYADTIRLAVFAHTHMDEIRSLHREAVPASAGGAGSLSQAIAIKLVPSVTPYFGNHPAFLVAAVDPHTLALKDWQTFVSPDSDGSAAPWPAAYRYSAAYRLPDFSGASAKELADGFTSDREGKSALSGTYRAHFFAGDGGLYALGLGQIWPAYACAVREHEPEGFHNCLCPPAAAPAK